MRASRIATILSKPGWRDRTVFIKVADIVYYIGDISRHIRGVSNLDIVTIDASAIDDNISEELKIRSEKP